MEIKNSRREKLIISADDFGKSHLANKNILTLARTGRIDRVAFLIDGDIENLEVAELLNFGVKLDIHLNLKKFKSGPDESRSVFKRGVLFLWLYFSGQGTSSRVAADWERQIKKFEEVFGKKPDGLNSHQYVHFFPPYFKIILRLGAKYQIPYLRFGKIGITEGANSISGILTWLWKINNSRFKKFFFDSSDFLASYDWIRDFPRFLSELPSGKTELISHPERKEELEAINKYFQN